MMRVTTRLLLASACLLMCGCSSDSPPTGPTTSATEVGFTTGLSYLPSSPAPGDTVTISFTLGDDTTDGTAVSEIPYEVTLDGTVVYQGDSSAIPANGTSVTSIGFQIATSGDHTIVVTLDPDGVTGYVDPQSDSQYITIFVFAAVVAESRQWPSPATTPHQARDAGPQRSGMGTPAL